MRYFRLFLLLISLYVLPNQLMAKENVRSFKSVISEFEDLHSCSNFRFSFHKVWQEKDDNELKSGVIDLKSSVSGMNFISNMHSYFGDSVNPCYGDYANNLVVNYNGDVFKCTAREFNTENKIGKLMNDGKVIYNDNALKRERNRWTYDCYTCRRLPICPICSQVKSESSDGKCPVNISSEAISENIREYCIDLQTKIKHT